MQYRVLYILGQLAVLTFASKLDKAPLTGQIEDLFDDLIAHLPLPKGMYSKWDPGWIPQDCKDIAQSKNLQAIDVEVYDVHYDDCDTPWILCHHKDSVHPVAYMMDRFGRVPVRARTYVRHVLDLPDHQTDGTYAFSENNNIALMNKADDMLGVLIHEVAHSLDGLKVFHKEGPLSESKLWSDAYAADSKVPDEYSQTSFAEDVAQNTLVAAYDLNVPGGLQKVQKDWSTIKNQYSLIKSLSDEAGKNFSEPGNILMPGGKCGKRLTDSQRVRMEKPARRRGVNQARRRNKTPDVSLPRSY